MAKIGRNDPCPCGSGKKYKQCCYGKEVDLARPDAAVRQDPEWYKIRLAEAKAEYAILAFALEKYGDERLKEASAEFGVWGNFEVDQLHFESIFPPWVAFSWAPVTAAGPRPLGLDYLDEASDQLNEYEQRFVREACAQPFSFFVVSSVVEGKSLSVRDIFLGPTFTVKEAKASRKLTGGDVIFARVVPLDGQAIFAGFANTRSSGVSRVATFQEPQHLNSRRLRLSTPCLP